MFKTSYFYYYWFFKDYTCFLAFKTDEELLSWQMLTDKFQLEIKFKTFW